MIEDCQAEKWIEVLAQVVGAMRQDGLNEVDAANLLERMAKICRPGYAISRERAPVYEDIVPTTARAAWAEWMRAIGRVGGAANKGKSTERKAAASRANGRKGGRPRKERW